LGWRPILLEYWVAAAGGACGGSLGMKAGWELKKLRDVCELVNGRAYGKPELLAEGKYRVLRVGNFFTNNHWYYSDLELEDKKYCDQGDLLYAWSASFGPRIWTGEKVIYHYHIWKVVPNPSLIDQRYLFHFFNWDTESIKDDQGAGTTMMHVSKGSMEDRDIQVPPLPEQQRIVTLLDEAFDGIATAKASAEKNLHNARAIFETHLQSVFTQRGDGWEVRSLGEVCERVEYGTSAKSKEQGTVPVLRMGNIQNGKFDWEKLVFTNDDAEIKKYQLKNNDVLFNRTNSPELVGKTAIFKNERPAIFAGYLIRIHRKQSLLDADYLTYFLNSKIAMDYGKTVTISSVNQANINGAKLKTYPIPVPSLKAQQAAVCVMHALRDETQRLESIYQQKLTALKELKKSLLHQAFSGAL
jgi:type I restriction enzyme, S subunit